MTTSTFALRSVPAVPVAGVPVLAFRTFGVRPSHRSDWAVRGVSLQVPEGQVTALVGPPGEGSAPVALLPTRCPERSPGYLVGQKQVLGN